MVVPEDGCSTMSAELAQRVDQLRAAERLHRHDVRRRARGDRRRRARLSSADMKTRAAVFHGAGRPLEVREIELDEPRDDEVVVRMVSVGICGTDLHMRQRRVAAADADGRSATRAPGSIEEVGSGVSSVRPGDRVVLSWAPSCGECADCARGRPAACVPLHRAIGAGTLVDGRTGMSLDGETVYRGTATGALAERVVVAERVALPLGEDVPLEEAALLGCAALTGVGRGAVLRRACSQTLRSSWSARAASASSCVQGARIAGAETVVSVDPVEARRDQALQLGATAAVAPEDLKQHHARPASGGRRLRVRRGRRPGDDGARAALDTQRRQLRVVVGLPAAGARLDLDPGEFNRREKWLTGTMYGSEDPAVALPVLLEHVRAGRLALHPLLGPSFPLERVNDAIEASLAGSAGARGGAAVIEQVEHVRVAWVDTDAGGRIHFTAVFRWVEAAEVALMRRLGLMAGWGNFPGGTSRRTI